MAREAVDQFLKEFECSRQGRILKALAHLMIDGEQI
jgi:hypothetical protein